MQTWRLGFCFGLGPCFNLLCHMRGLIDFFCFVRFGSILKNWMGEKASFQTPRAVRITVDPSHIVIYIIDRSWQSPPNNHHFLQPFLRNYSSFGPLGSAREQRFASWFFSLHSWICNWIDHHSSPPQEQAGWTGEDFQSSRCTTNGKKYVPGSPSYNQTVPGIVLGNKFYGMQACTIELPMWLLYGSLVSPFMVGRVWTHCHIL